MCSPGAAIQRASLRSSACRQALPPLTLARSTIALIQFDPNQLTASNHWIAVSTGDDPAGGYCLYNLAVQSVGPSGGFFPLPDFPRLGQDRQAIYLASDLLILIIRAASKWGRSWCEVFKPPIDCQAIFTSRRPR
jgi:hypothetical protein